LRFNVKLLFVTIRQTIFTGGLLLKLENKRYVFNIDRRGDETMAKNTEINMTTGKKKSKKRLLREKEPLVSPKIKKLSKAGEWMLANPNGLTVEYVDWKALLK